MESFICPVCGVEITGKDCSKFRVQGGEDEAKPFSILYEMTCPNCETVISVERDYDFDKGLVGCAFTW